MPPLPPRALPALIDAADAALPARINTAGAALPARINTAGAAEIADLRPTRHIRCHFIRAPAMVR